MPQAGAAAAGALISRPASANQELGGAPVLEVLYEDSELIAVQKPAGLLVHRTRLAPRDRAALLQAMRDQRGERLYPIHRLDRATSGLVVLARSPAAQARWSGYFARREVTKTYLALVRGWLPDQGTIDYPLAAPGADRASARAAVTAFRSLARLELPVRVDRYATSRYALVLLNPHTGRTHQLRRHLHHLSHPIIGDTSYGQGRHNRLFRERLDSHRLLLAAVELALTAPDGAARVFTAPLAPEFWSLLVALGLAPAVPERWRPPGRYDQSRVDCRRTL
jgi:tRNA pseudouridine65 synthase